MTTRIAYTDYDALRARCDVTDVRLVTDDPAYESFAVVPTNAWHPIDLDTANRLQSRPDTPDGAVVELTRPPTDLAAQPDHPLLQHATFLGVSRPQPPGLVTTTVSDQGTGLRIGIHLDIWDRQPYGTRHHSRRRLCINLGPGARYLLLADHTIQDLGAALGDDPHHQPPIDTLHRYLRAEHPLTCLRLRIDPGHGYLAPTELLPHDGSTHQQTRPSTTSTWLGHWKTGVFGSVI